MNDTEYLEWKNKFPQENTLEFITALQENNRVIIDNLWWLGIQNIKYHSPKFPHLTFFCKTFKQHFFELNYEELASLKNIQEQYPEWMFYINANSQQSIERFHFHLVKSYPNWLEQMMPLRKQSVAVLTKRITDLERELALIKNQTKKEELSHEFDYVNCENCKLTYRMNEWKNHLKKDHSSKKPQHTVTKFAKYLMAWTK